MYKKICVNLPRIWPRHRRKIKVKRRQRKQLWLCLLLPVVAGVSLTVKPFDRYNKLMRVTSFFVELQVNNGQRSTVNGPGNAPRGPNL
jgi:hypothetical protein